MILVALIRVTIQYVIRILALKSWAHVAINQMILPVTKMLQRVNVYRLVLGWRTRHVLIALHLVNVLAIIRQMMMLVPAHVAISQIRSQSVKMAEMVGIKILVRHLEELGRQVNVAMIQIHVILHPQWERVVTRMHVNALTQRKAVVRVLVIDG
tara:strand:+ start:204 stop:665 length:462 start_codon:yes stop_codon:yes gene_type:complete